MLLKKKVKETHKTLTDYRLITFLQNRNLQVFQVFIFSNISGDWGWDSVIPQNSEDQCIEESSNYRQKREREREKINMKSICIRWPTIRTNHVAYKIVRDFISLINASEEELPPVISLKRLYDHAENFVIALQHDMQI